MAKPRKKVVTWLVALVVVVGIVVALDRVAVAIAEDKIADQIATKAAENGVHSKTPPNVDVTGFPFLTQVIGGEYSQIDMTLTDVGTDSVTLPKLTIRAYDVTAAVSDVLGGTGQIVAARVEADGEISYDSLTAAVSEATGVTATSDGNGMLTVRASLDVLGQSIPIVGTASVSFDGSVLSVQAQGFNADGVDLPPGGEELLNSFAETFNRAIEIPPLPYGITLESLDMTESAMVIKGSAQNVPIG